MTTNAVEIISGTVFAQRLRRVAFAVAALSLVSVGAIRAAAESLDREAFLKAVAEVETGGNPRAIGRYGERGLYQFGRTTWARHSKRPFTDAHNPQIAHDVAVQHFVWLFNRLEANGTEPTAYRLAVAWNGGLGRAISGRAPKSTRDYARRVSMLSAKIQAARAAATEATVLASGGISPVGPTPASPTPVRLDFSIDDAMVAYYAAPEVVPLNDPTNEVPFSLAVSPGATNGSSLRFFLATIAE